MDYGNAKCEVSPAERARDFIRQNGMGAQVAQPRKQTSADAMVNDMRNVAQRVEGLAERINSMLGRLGAPQPPIGGTCGPADVPNGYMGAFNEQANRARGAISEAESFLNELEQHI